MDYSGRDKTSISIDPKESMLEKYVQIVTSDGRIFVGYLRGLDQALNLILGECEERIYTKTSGIKTEKMGLFIIRGDNVALIGEIDEELEMNLDMSSIKVDQLKPFVN